MSHRMNFDIHEVSGTIAPLVFDARHLVIAGWAGRDELSLRRHIDELEALGIAPPSQTPLFYRAAPRLLSQAPVVQVLGDSSSGEVEPLWLQNGRDIFIGLGSDHTDRDAEAWSVPHSKQLCDKPVATAVWRFTDVAGHWDQLVLRSWIPAKPGEWTLYQEGLTASLRRPGELAALAGDLAAGTAMLCGTLPAIGGIRPSSSFRMQIHDPVLGRSLGHEYEVVTLPIVT